MTDPVHLSSAAMLFERNDALVVEAFRRGEFDYLEGGVVGDIENSPKNDIGGYELIGL